MNRLAPLALVAIALQFSCGGAQSPPDSTQTSTVETRFQMGTLVRIAVAEADTPATRAAIAGGFAAIDDVVAVMSEWEPESDISRVNDASGGVAVTVDASLIEVLEVARGISDASGGAFDVTWAALRGLWCFEPECELPNPSALAAAVALIDYSAVEIDRDAASVRLPAEGMAMGLGSIAKGYAIARAADALRAAGAENFLIDAGGDIYAAGTAFGTAWTVAVAQPRGVGVLDTVTVRDAVVVTSGDYENYIERGGVRYHHILDVRTGWPARGVVQVTVVAADATVADGLATAAFVLGPDAGLQLLEGWVGVQGLIVDEDLQVHATSGWPGLGDG